MGMNTRALRADTGAAALRTCNRPSFGKETVSLAVKGRQVSNSRRHRRPGGMRCLKRANNRFISPCCDSQFNPASVLLGPRSHFHASFRAQDKNCLKLSRARSMQGITQALRWRRSKLYHETSRLKTIIGFHGENTFRISPADWRFCQRTGVQVRQGSWICRFIARLDGHSPGCAFDPGFENQIACGRTVRALRREHFDGYRRIVADLMETTF